MTGQAMMGLVGSWRQAVVISGPCLAVSVIPSR